MQFNKPFMEFLWFSNFVVMKSNGKCYTGQAVMSSGTRIIRIDANGNYDNFITPAFPLWREVWDMAYHCTTGNIYGMGGSTGSVNRQVLLTKQQPH